MNAPAMPPASPETASLLSDEARGERYSAVAKALHWTIAVLIIAQFVGGKFMTHLALPTDVQFNSYQMHKSFGFVVLILSVFRLYWRQTHRPPALPPATKGWERAAANATHVAFYGLMIGVPLLGWLLVSVAPVEVPTKIFFLIPVPHFPLPATEAVYGVFEYLHGLFATLTIGLLVLHVAAALKHHYIARDRVLLRMLPVRDWATGRIAVPALIAALSGVAAVYLGVMLVRGGDEEAISPPAQRAEVTAADASAPGSVREEGAWIIDSEPTTVTLSGAAYGNPQQVTLSEVKGTIVLDPADIGRARIDVSLPLASLEAGSAILEQLAAPAWFDISAFPEVRFTSAEVIEVGDGSFEARGPLTIKGIAVPVVVPFSLRIEAGRAVADGDLTVDRTAFGVGAPGGGVDAEVVVALHVEAEKPE